MPAALALGVRQRRRGHLLCDRLDDVRSRDDEHILEVIAERGQRGVFVAVGGNGHGGLQRRADPAFDAQIFQHLGHLAAHRADQHPLGEQFRFAILRRQRLPSFQHDRVTALAEFLPRLFRGEGEDRCHQLEEGAGDVPQRTLRRATGARIALRRVETVLEDVEVETAEIFRTEVLQGLHDAVEFIAIVVGLGIRLQLARHGQRVTINLQPLGHRQQILPRVEVGRRVGEQESQGIADAAIGFGHTLEDLVRDRQLARVIGGGRPQAQDIGAERVGHLLRRDDVALRLGHLHALAIDDEAVRQQRLVRRAAIDGAASQERALEPATMLVRTFKVEIGREHALLGVRATHHREMRRAGIEPDVERVAHLAVLGRFVTEQLLRIEREPAFDTGLFDALGHLLDQFRRARMQRAGFLVQEERDRHAPVALARDAPVRTRLHHRFQSRAAPGREELRLVNGTLGDPAQGRRVLVELVFHADEPLRRRPEDDRRLVAPAVRIAVADLLGLEQHAPGFQFLQHQRVGFPNRLAGDLADRQRRHVTEEPAIVADRVGHRQAVFLADHVVVHTMRRCGMHLAGTGFGGDVRTADDRHVAALERVAQQHLVERRALAGTDHRAFEFVALEAGLGQFTGKDQRALRRFNQVVVELRMHTHRLVGRQRPRGCRPDHGEGRAAQMRQAEGLGHLLRVVFMHRESDIDRRRGLVLVLDLGLGQRRTAIQTPVHRLQALVEIALLEDLADRADLVRFGLEAHRQVGVVPFAKDAEADEILLLALDLFRGESAAQFAHLVGRNVLAVQLLDLVLDRQAVAIPARHVRRIEACQRARADDDVLEDLVHRMADVDVTVGVGRTIVQHETPAARRCLADLLVELLLLPCRHPGRLALGEVAAHRERRIGKVQCVLVVSHLRCLGVKSLKSFKA